MYDVAIVGAGVVGAMVARELSAFDIKICILEKVNIEIVTDGKIRYTVPQRITEKKDVMVYFRVSDVYRNVKISVCDGENVVFSKKKAKVVPGEMERVELKSDVFKKADKLCFKLEEM